MDFGQYVDRFAPAYDQVGTQILQRPAQSRRAFGHEGVVPPGQVGLPPKAGFDDQERQHRPGPCRLGQRRVIVDAQISFEPDDLNHPDAL